jgi:hypothetical protein
MKNANSQSYDPFSVIEGPAWGDAEFYARWLASAAKAQGLWKKALKDREFRRQVKQFLYCYIPDFGMGAAALLGQLWKNGVSALVDLSEEQYSTDFAMMVTMGFFKRTGKRYQMTVPDQLNIEAVKSAALQMTHTLNSNYMPQPGVFVTSMRKDEARACRKRLRDMNQDLRIGKRSRLLRNAA